MKGLSSQLASGPGSGVPMGAGVLQIWRGTMRVSRMASCTFLGYHRSLVQTGARFFLRKKPGCIYFKSHTELDRWACGRRLSDISRAVCCPHTYIHRYTDTHTTHLGVESMFSSSGSGNQSLTGQSQTQGCTSGQRRRFEPSV